MKYLRIGLLIIICGVFITACDTFQPSQLCGEETEADHQAFTQVFSEIQLVNLDGSYNEENAEQTGRVFYSPVSLSMIITSLEETELRLCIFGAKRNGKVILDESFTVAAGQESIRLGDYTKGPYIIRIYSDGTLVENIPFIVKTK